MGINITQRRAVKVFQPLTVQLASTPAEIMESQALRYQVFSQEQGAFLETSLEGFDIDHHDKFCEHLLVRNSETGAVVGSTRILTLENARHAGSFYSEQEFDLRGLFPLNGNAIEIGRTCIHPHYRNGAGIATLWSGLAQYIERNHVDYLFGCASISMADGGAQAAAIMNMIRQDHTAPDTFSVKPHVRLLPTNPASTIHLPPLLKTYLKLGAWVVGEPCLDPDFNVADVFILLDRQRLDSRYQRFFMRKNKPNSNDLLRQKWTAQEASVW